MAKWCFTNDQENPEPRVDMWICDFWNTGWSKSWTILRARIKNTIQKNILVASMQMLEQTLSSHLRFHHCAVIRHDVWNILPLFFAKEWQLSCTHPSLSSRRHTIGFRSALCSGHSKTLIFSCCCCWFGWTRWVIPFHLQLSNGILRVFCQNWCCLF